MKDQHDQVTYDIFQQDTLKWLEENVETIARQHEGYFRLSYIVGDISNSLTARLSKTVSEWLGVNCDRLRNL